MSITNGVVTTSLIWTPPGLPTPSNGSLPANSSGIKLVYTIFAHRTKLNLGVVRLDVEGLTPGMQLSVTDVLDVSWISSSSPRSSKVTTNLDRPTRELDLGERPRSIRVLYQNFQTRSTPQSIQSESITSPPTSPRLLSSTLSLLTSLDHLPAILPSAKTHLLFPNAQLSLLPQMANSALSNT